MKPKTIKLIRKIARIWSAVMAGMILLAFIANGFNDGIGPIFHLTLRETLMMAAFMIVWLGLIMGWKWEKLGGFLIIAGMLVFYIFDYLFSGSFPRGPTFLLIALPGFLFLICGYYKNPGGEDDQTTS